MRKLLILLLLLFASPATADQVFKAYLGANGMWFDHETQPSEFEAGVTGRASLSPHISLVGSGWRGFENDYWRGTFGARVTATDVANPNFSCGIGIQRQISSDLDLHPEEWIPDASIGWRAWPLKMPHIVLVAQGGYGLTTTDAHLTVGARYSLGH